VRKEGREQRESVKRKKKVVVTMVSMPSGIFAAIKSKNGTSSGTFDDNTENTREKEGVSVGKRRRQR
jgi:hypothetical protein